MSTLIVHELETSLTQTITVTAKKLVKSIRPHIYKANSPAGSLTLSIESGGTEVATVTQTIAFIEANVASNNTYFHGFVKFEFDNQVLLPSGDYDLILTGSGGYTFDTNTYIGWCADFEDRLNADTSTPSGITQYPFAFEMWSLK